jgi:hypothetical protein
VVHYLRCINSIDAEECSDFAYLMHVHVVDGEELQG